MSDAQADPTVMTSPDPEAPAVPLQAPRVPWAAVAVFAIVSCGLAWLVASPLWVRGLGMTDPLLPVIAAAMMLTPAIATIAALLVERRRRGRRGARGILHDLGMWPLRPVGRTLGMSAAAIVVLPLLIAAGLLVVGLLGLARFDLVGFSGFAAQLDAVLPQGTPAPPIVLLVAMQLVMIPVGAVVNAPFAFGEEIGWRGWLLPALRPLGVWPALLVSGAFWGFWHSPLILLGYNFGLTDITGVLLMILACMVLGVLLGWTRLRTGSVWPAVFGHGAFNAAAGLGALVVAADSSVPPAWLAGPAGLITCAVMAAVVAVLVAAGQFRRDRLDARLG
ncbi:membrane protease YdiL (CAAX protease family) [Agromyces hippuratus]|uniref:Membrane protease YdiL (CAAX protease family) n=1 Tax=Agromyces hippuratus TaxID=286438 RepID=A0A852X1H7_9MICO|nr:CPBP family intramembrane glutamic endopeptidase [Agromyces hippuratus]NYG22400.1 membrane protease YdiL (CAAX protease family) [Agromyces hippuratus]